MFLMILSIDVTRTPKVSVLKVKHGDYFTAGITDNKVWKEDALGEQKLIKLPLCLF
jgi:hypothetical protein